VAEVEKVAREHSGRQFNAEDIAMIIATTQMYPKLSQKEMASTVCELIGWTTPNGKPKVVQCVMFLRQLEAEGLIKLPAIKTEKVRQGQKGSKPTSKQPTGDEIELEEIHGCGALSLEIVKPGKRLAQWRKYVSSYHKLGDPRVLGSQIRYMIKTEGQDLGCLLFSASSWALAPREKWIGWSAGERKAHLYLIVNNSRFLILPWVHVKNLASRVLSMAARRIQRDWLAEYCYAPVLLETFVEPPYKGTCYKASNWIYLGETQGRGRNDRHNEWALTQKSIYALPLQHNFRDVLKGRKPCKAVNPDVE
jgi:hypothetical protein